MRKPKEPISKLSPRRLRPALTPEARENQMIALAVDLAEKQLIDGTASSQVITHYLKLGTEQYKKELERLEKENELLRARTENIKRAERVEEAYAEVIQAIKRYSGVRDEEE